MSDVNELHHLLYALLREQNEADRMDTSRFGAKLNELASGNPATAGALLEALGIALG